MRKLLAFAAPFSLAVLLCCYLLPLEYTAWVGGVCLLLAPLGLLRRGKARLRAILGALGLGAGFLWFFLWSVLFLGPSVQLAGTTASVSATALDFPVATDTGVAVDVELEDGVPARLYVEGELTLTPGDGLEFTADFTAADVLYGEESSYFSSRGVFLLAFAHGGEVTVLPAQRTPLRFLPRLWARSLKESLDRLFSPEHAALLRAMLLGDKSGLTAGMTALFNRSGLAHVLVVSGLHMSVLLRGLTLLLRRRRRWLVPVAIPVLLLFVFMVGCTPSAVRSAVMSSLLLLAPALGREADSPTSLSFALFVLLVLNPYSAAGVSLQLSFASVAGILLVPDPLEEVLRSRTLTPAKTRVGAAKNRVLSFLWGSLSVSLGAMVFTTPLLALYFGSVSLAAPLSNLLTLWAVGILFTGGLLVGSAGLFVPGAAALAARPLGVLCEFLLEAVARLGTPSYAALDADFPLYALWLGAVYLIAGGSVLLAKKRRVPLLLPLGMAVILLVAALSVTRATFLTPPLTVTVLDVGQGSSTLLCSGGKAALVDCGGSCAEGAGNTAADHLQGLGICAVEVLVFTHLDEDHCNGAEALFARMEIRQVILPARRNLNAHLDRLAQIEELAAHEGAQVTFLTQETELPLGRAALHLYPALNWDSDPAEGVYVLCSAGEFDVLVTGDASATEEISLLWTYPLPDLELLVAGHHGSASSTSPTLLKHTTPDFAAVSCGHNHYGHPHADTLARLKQAGIPVLRTDERGHITLTAGADGHVDRIFTTR